jgi:argininosuccinate lyase
MKLWGGRFSGKQNALAADFTNSVAFDYRLGAVDVRASQAWAKALGRAGILTPDEARQIDAGLAMVLDELTAGSFEFQPSDEDIHTAVERRLIELIGPTGGKLHTGRSRNDQVATDFRLWVLETIRMVQYSLRAVQAALLRRAENDFGLLIPGYTHLQRAQPILLSHWWLGHFWPLQRDHQRLEELYGRTSVMPLGSAALAGVPFAIDRQTLASDLGFASASPNSLDAVSDRDFAVEFLFCAALIGVHLSRLAEMLILYATSEFGFIQLADAYSTGSSLMPQKKNPDPLELTRGKTGALIGQLTGLLAVLKATPSAYDKDLQEDKLPVFQAADTLRQMLPVLAGLLDTLIVRQDNLLAALDPAMLATDLADYLVVRGVPFREAHHLVGQVVRKAEAAGLSLDRLPLSDLQAIHPAFQDDVVDVFDFQAAVARRASPGGTAPTAVRDQLTTAKRCLKPEGDA